ncbi:Acetyltransferase (GNAT) family protein [Alkalibacterium subtropicum]|uniref:Acetyltransferase (GNAT) family protein n=1 Tax=Alkalibacterium subtropicum TaxID=753702 RepID=A0A1I1ID10_9LACT|nr:Acetyltransferase (GNAT) family protein [Alkalibacterium subtropicum]
MFATMLDQNSQGKGHAEEVVRRVVDYGFCQLNLNKITLDVMGFNKKAVHIYQKVGFEVEGKKIQEYYIKGNYYDSLAKGLLREKYENGSD